MKKLLIIFLLLGLVFRVVISFQIYSGDVNNHVAWGKDSIVTGYPGMYEREFMKRYGVLTPTYPPVPIYLWTFSYWLYDWTYKTSWKLNVEVPEFPSNFIFFLEDQDTLPAFTKVWSIFADIGIAYLVYVFAKKLTRKENSKWPIIAASLVLFNPAFFYNSAYWGQLEAPPEFFLLLAFYLLFYTKKKAISAIAFTLALLTKQTSIVFIPIFALSYFKQVKIKEAIKYGFVSLGIFWLAFLPFYKTGSLVAFPFTTYLNKIQTGSGSDQVVNHAFNFWYLIVGDSKILDKELFFGVPFAVWGYLVFFGFVALVIYKLFKNKIDNYSTIFACTLIPYVSFLFLTKMQTRYFQQIIPFLLILVLYKRKFLWIFIYASFFYFLTLYHNWWAPRYPWLVSLLSTKETMDVLAIITLGVFGYLLVTYLITKPDAKS